MPEKEDSHLLANESFINYCLDRNEVDISKWEEYLQANPHERERIDALKSIVRLTSKAVSEIELQSQLEKLEQGIPLEEEQLSSLPFKTGRRSLSWMAVAALIVGVLLISTATLYFLTGKKNETAPVAASFDTHKGQRRTFFLPDGSKVVLNAESHILLAEDFNIKQRVVKLSGEAFFDVTHDTSKPFIVQTHDMDIKVLGTAFNVKAYDGDETSETSLIRGRIELSLKKDNKKVILRPNEKYLLHTAGSLTVNKSIRKSEVFKPVSGLQPVHISKKDAAVVEVAWTENKLIFIDEPFESLVKKLSRWYGVDIEIADSALKNTRYTASFRNENLNDVLTALQFTKAFSFKHENDSTIIINK